MVEHKKSHIKNLQRFNIRALICYSAVQHNVFKSRSPFAKAALQTMSRRASSETVGINKTIAQFARQKKFIEAKVAFEDARRRGLANSHTYAATINAFVRCGYVNQAEELLSRMESAEVVSYTTVMKGLCGVGQLEKAIGLADKLVDANITPNIRTANTLLRGCVRVGAVERCRDLLKKMQKQWKVVPDASSWEYVVSLLCRGLAVEQAKTIVGRLKQRTESPDIYNNPALYLNLCRCSTILGQWKPARKAAAKAVALLDDEEKAQREEESNSSSGSQQLNKVVGGKQGWRSQAVSETRSRSLSVFKRHRRSEMRAEIDLLKAFIEEHKSLSTGDHAVTIANHMKRLHLFPLDERLDESNCVKVLVEGLCKSFGLKQLMQHCKNIKLEGFQDHYSTVYDGSKNIDVSKAFCRTDESSNRVKKMEICSGAGEWVVSQASADPNSDWFSLEILYDRVYQIFCRSIFENCSNLSIVAGDASHILPHHFLGDSIDYIFVNYPEPPQQIGGESSQSSHLLNAEFFKSMSRVVTKTGCITIITDNEWYGNLLIKIASGVTTVRGVQFAQNAKRRVISRAGDVCLYEGSPGEETGLSDASASSYFDRLWQREQQRRRFFITVRHCEGRLHHDSPGGNNFSNSSIGKKRKNTSGKKKKKKKKF